MIFTTIQDYQHQLLSQKITCEDTVLQYIADIKKHLQNHDKNLELVFSYLDKLIDKENQPRKRIGFKPDDL